MLQMLQTTVCRHFWYVADLANNVETTVTADTADKNRETSVICCKVMMVITSDLIHMDMPASCVSQLDDLARLCSQKPTGTMVQNSRLTMVGTSQKQQALASPCTAAQRQSSQTARSCCSLTLICNYHLGKEGTNFAAAT